LRHGPERCKSPKPLTKINDHAVLAVSVRPVLDFLRHQWFSPATVFPGRGRKGNPAEQYFHEFSQSLSHCKSEIFARGATSVRIGNTEISHRADSHIPDE
jgi:hypothetical protein